MKSTAVALILGAVFVTASPIAVGEVSVELENRDSEWENKLSPIMPRAPVDVDDQLTTQDAGTEDGFDELKKGKKKTKKPKRPKTRVTVTETKIRTKTKTGTTTVAPSPTSSTTTTVGLGPPISTTSMYFYSYFYFP